MLSKRTLKLIFLLAKKIPNVKWDIIITAEIAEATPKPSFPYAKRQIGRPIFPQLGKINGGSSLIKSLFCTIRMTNPIIENPITANKV